MDYRDRAIKVIKIACQDFMDKAEDIIPKTDGVIGVDVIIHIPSLTDGPDIIPTIDVKTKAYTSRIASEKIIELLK